MKTSSERKVINPQPAQYTLWVTGSKGSLPISDLSFKISNSKLPRLSLRVANKLPKNLPMF